MSIKNYVDNKLCNLKKELSEKDSIKLINTLYYKLNNNNGDTTQQNTYTSDNGETEFVASTILTNKNWVVIPDTRVLFNSHRLPANNNNSPIKNAIIFEKMYFKDIDGDEFEISSLYNDEGNTAATEVDSVKFMALGGIGKYENISYVIIKYDNDTVINEGEGSERLREVNVYGK